MIEGWVRRGCEGVAGFSVRRRGMVLGVIVVVTVVSLVLMGRLTVSGSIGDIVGDASPAALALGTIGARFDVGEELLVLVTAPADVDDARGLLTGYAAAFERALWEDGRSAGLVREVRWRGDTSVGAWMDEVGMRGAGLLLDDERFGELRRRMTEEGVRERVRRLETLLAAPGPLAQEAATAAIEDPLDVRGLLIEQLREEAGGLGGEAGPALSRDGRSLLIGVSAKATLDDLDASKRLVALAGDVVEAVGDGRVRAVLTGGPAIAAQSATSIRHDLIWSVVGAVVAVHVLFLIVYRGMWAFGIVTLPAGLGIVWAFGVEGLIGGRITALGAAIGAILVGLGVDYAVHAASSADGDARGAIGRVGGGIIGAAATTVIAFGALATSKLAILHGFAAIGSMGLAGAVVATIVLMPILLDGRVRARRFGLLGGLRSARVAGVFAAVSVAVGVASAGWIVVRVASGGRVVGVDESLDSMHPSPSPALAAQRMVDEAFGSNGDGLPVLIEAADEGELVRRAHAVGAALRGAEGVRGVVGIDVLVPTEEEVAARRARAGSVDWERVGRAFESAEAGSVLAEGALAAAAARLKSMLSEARVPRVDDLRDGVGRMFLAREDGGGPAAVSYVMVDRPMETRGDRAEVAEGISRRIEDVAGATLTGLGVLGYEAERLAAREAPRLLGLALGGVAVWLVLYFRRAGDVLLALLPGAFAFVVLVAAIELSGWTLNLVSMAAFPLLVGIGVDDGIFLVSAAREVRGRADAEKALRARLAAVSHAVVTTSATTVLAFGSLALTSTPAIRSLGMLVGIGVAACLWGTLFVLAPVLLWLARRGEEV